MPILGNELKDVPQKSVDGDVNFEARLTTVDGIPVTCESRCQRSHGGCDLKYVAFTAGDHLLHIHCRGCAVRGSPFRVRVSAAAAFAPHCAMSGPGTTHARPGQLAKFSVHLRDRWHNVCTDGSAKIVVQASGPAQPIISVLDLFDGTHQVAARYGLSGTYQLSVSVRTGGQQLPVEGSPLLVVVSRANHNQA